MGVFLNWLTESAIAAPSVRSETTTMAEKLEIAGGMANFRQLVDEYRQKAELGEGYDIDEDPLFMNIEKFKSTYGK